MAQPFVISIKAFLDGKGVKSGAQESKAAVADLGKTTTSEMNRMSSMAGMFNRQIAAIGFTLLASFGPYAMTRTLAGFEGSMAGVQAVTRATASEISALREKAQELGATTEFSASQAAGGLRFLGMAGFTATQSIAALPATLDLATIAQMDLGTSADITSNIMSGFRIEAEQTSRVVDILAATSSRSNTSVFQLGDAMKYVAPIAAGMKISIEETAAAIGVMSDAGMQGSMAGTGLRMIIASLIDPTSDAKKALAEFGLSAEAVNPATHSLAEIMQTMIAAGVDATNIFKIMEARAATAWVTLSGGIPKLKSLTQTLNEATGEGENMARVMRDNLQGDLQGLASAAEAVTLSLGDAGLTGTLRTSAQTGTTVLRALADQSDLLRAGLTTLVAGGIVLVARSLNTAAGSAAAYVGAQLGAMQAARASAVAEQANAAARLRSAEAAMAVARANGLVTGSYAVLSRELLAARMGMAAANATMAQTTIGARAASIAARGLSAAYALIGGPVGVALLAGYAVYELWQTQERAAEASRLHEQALKDNAKAIEKAKSGSQQYRDQLQAEITAQISSAQAAVDAAKKKVEAARTVANSQSLFDQVLGFLSPSVRDARANVLAQFNADADTASQRLNALQRQLFGFADAMSMTLPAGSTAPGTGDGSAGDIASADADKIEQAYNKILTSIDRKTAALRLEAATLGMTAEETSRLTLTQELLNQAVDAGVKLTPDVVRSLSERAAGYARLESSVKRMKEAYDFGKQGMRSFFADTKSYILQNMGEWKSWGDWISGIFRAAASAGASFIQKLSDKALEAAADGVWDLLWGGIKGIFGGGLDFTPGVGSFETGLFAKGGVFGGKTGLDAYANQVVAKPTFFTFAKGASFGVMGEAGEEAVMPLTRGSDGRLGVTAYANGNSAGGQVSIQPIYAPVFNFPKGTSREDMQRLSDRERREFDRMVTRSVAEGERRARAG